MNYVLLALGSAPIFYFIIAPKLRIKPIPGIPHHPITSFWGDIPRLASDTEKFGTIFDGDAIVPTGVKALGPIFQVRGTVTSCCSID